MNLSRSTAADYHSGQFSALYAFASSGVVTAGLPREIAACFAIAASPREYRRLQCLYAETAPAVSIETIESAREFWHRTARNADGSPVRCRRNGKLKTWIKTLGAFRLPVKHGLKQCFYITPHNAQYWVPAPSTDQE